jgi:hypothetical protein
MSPVIGCSVGEKEKEGMVGFCLEEVDLGLSEFSFGGSIWFYLREGGGEIGGSVVAVLIASIYLCAWSIVQDSCLFSRRLCNPSTLSYL